MKKKFTITIGPNTHVFEQKNIGNGDHGQFNSGTGNIVIDENQPEAGKHEVVIHELMHLLNEYMVQAGITKRHVPEKFILNLAPALLACLVKLGFYTGISQEEYFEYYGSEEYFEKLPKAEFEKEKNEKRR